ncbi:MAG: hypothetical protein J1G02_02950 [Clostridiales bacterium]|nr:hypothetical protein [Clostridiales bacterium]
MSKRVRVITLSCLTVLCCIAIIIAGTFALFTDDVTVTSHLKAGKLKVSLERNHLENSLLNPQTGRVENTTDDSVVTFTSEDETDANVNIFGLSEDDRVAPGCSVTATFKLTNDGDVAVGYYLQFRLGKDDETDEELAKQIEITITVGSQVHTFFLSEIYDAEQGIYEWGNDSTYTDRIVNKDANATFKVKWAFVNDLDYNADVDGDEDKIDNNDAQDKNVYIDMTVCATQVI